MEVRSAPPSQNPLPLAAELGVATLGRRDPLGDLVGRGLDRRGGVVAPALQGGPVQLAGLDRGGDADDCGTGSSGPAGDSLWSHEAFS